MRNKMILVSLLSIIILTACNDSRGIPTPVEQTRPEFQSVVSPKDSAFAYDRTAPLQLRFSEPMDAASFPGNFILYEDDVRTIEVAGSFSAVDKDVIFQPDNPLLPGHEYFTFLRARVKDINGNGIDKDTLLVTETEFITDGDYTVNGLPEMVISNGFEDILSKVHIVENRFTADTAAAIDGFGRQLEMAFTLDGSKLIMSDYNTSGSKIYIFNAETYQLEKTLETNPGAEPAVKKSAEIVVSDTKAYVVNQSGKLISVIDLASETITDVITLPGIPKGMAILPDYSKIYVGSATNGQMWVLNTANNTVEQTLTITDFTRSVRLAASADGNYVIAREFRGDKLAFIETTSGTLASVLELGYEAKSGNNSDLAVLDDYVYVSASSGELSRIQISTQTLVNEIDHINFQGMDVFGSGEFLAAIAKTNPPALTLLNPETLKILREIPLPGSAPWDVTVRPRP